MDTVSGNYTPTGEKTQSELSPQAPISHHIPPSLRIYPQWICWTYALDEAGALRRTPVSQMASLDETYQRCLDEWLGLGFILLESDPFVAVHLLDYFDKASNKIKILPSEVMSLLDTYAEIDDTADGLHLIAMAKGETNMKGDGIEMWTQDYMIPITGDKIGIESEARPVQSEIRYVVETYCVQTWMQRVDRMQGSGSEKEILAHVLKDCLGTPGWLEDAERTGLFPFLGRCWGTLALRRMVRLQLRTDDYKYLSAKERTDIEAEIESHIPKKEKAPRQGVGDEPEINDGSNEIQIFSDDREHVGTEKCVEALQLSPNIFQKEGSIVILTEYDSMPQDGRNPDKILSIQIAEEDVIMDELSRYASYLVVSKSGETTVKHLPQKYASRVLKKPSHPYPTLTGCVTSPTIRHDGSVIETRGYDTSTGIYYCPSREYPSFSGSVNRDDAVAAYQRLKEPFRDFPFAQEYHKSAAISGVLSLCARHLIFTSPMIAVLSHTAGAGKGLATDVICAIATGKVHPISTLPRDENECANSFFAIATSGQRVTIYDNVSGLFGTDMLDGILTKPFVSTRKFHKQVTGNSTLQNVFFLNGNNVKFRGDLGRRVVPLVLLPTTQNPETRTDFTHPRLMEWTIRNHHTLLFDAITILRAYILADMPSQGMRFGSFEQWNDLVRSSLIWAGAPDPCEGRSEIQQESDTGLDTLYMLLNAWHDAFPNGYKDAILMKDLVAKIQLNAKLERVGDPHYPVDDAILNLGQALTAYDKVCKGKIADLNARSLSQNLPLTQGKSRVAGNLQLHTKATRNGGTKAFWVESREPEDSDDNGLPYPISGDEVPF